MAQRDSGDVIDILTTDHREMAALLGRIDATTDAAERRDLADMAIAEVMRHAVAEEMYVYPAIEDHLPDGASMVEHDKQEHDEIVQVMKMIEDADSTGPEFVAMVRRLGEILAHHVESEEAEQFPKLRSHIDAATLMELGQKVETAKKLAPTRPHPGAPHSELFHKTIGPGVGMVDRLMDKLTGRRT